MQLTIFKYHEDENNSTNDFTTIEIDGEPWFVAADVCAMLDIKNVSDAISSLDDDEKTTSVIPRGSRKVLSNLVNESGLYNLIFKSKKPSAKAFRKWVTKEVIPSIRKTGSFGINRIKTPNFIVRYNENWDRIDRGHFSVISELFIRLYGRFEHAGYQIPNKALDGKEIRPDNSVGMLFSKYLQAKYPTMAEDFKMYSHKFKNNVLPTFMQFIDEDWLPNHAARYFGERDKLALEYLPKLLAS